MVSEVLGALYSVQKNIKLGSADYTTYTSIKEKNEW